jgi:hypothetical protein
MYKALFAFAVFALGGVFKWILDHTLFDWFVRYLENNWQLKEADLLASVSSYVIPAIASGVIVYGAWWVGTRETRSKIGETANDRHAPALTLPTMKVIDIAEYLLDQSSWGWRQRRRLNLRQFVRDAVPDEMRRAGRGSEVRFIGTLPNSTEAKEINPGYWDAATFDEGRIWNSQNEFFTTTFGVRGNQNVYHLRFGRAPRIDVMRTWPRASLSLRSTIKALLWLRRARHGFSAVFKDQ